MTPRVIDYTSGDSPKPEVEYFIADPTWSRFPSSTKLSFLVFVEQALKTGSEGLVFEITSDGKAHIAFIIENRIRPIVTISSGIFDRYWDFLSTALQSSCGLKIKKGDDIFELEGNPLEMVSGRKLTLRIKGPFKKENLLETRNE